MTEFQVTVENLQGASALLASGLGLTSLGSGGAAAGTPVAGAWSELVDRANREISLSHETLSNLGRTVGLAARAYEIADQSAASSLQVKR